MGSRMILDTNVVLYHTQDLLAVPLARGVFSVSFVTEIEVLGFPGISEAEDMELCRMFRDDISVIGLTPAIKERAIQIRRTHRCKLPDALIVATAIELDVELLTNDLALANIPNLKCRSLQLKPS